MKPSERAAPPPPEVEALARELYDAYVAGRIRRVAWRPSKPLRAFDDLPRAKRTGWYAVARAAVEKLRPATSQ